MASEQSQSSADTITAFMEGEHTRIRGLWEEALSALDSEQFNALHGKAGDFIAALERHIRAEEQILFPSIEERSGDTEPTRAMKLEHRLMARMLERLKPLLTVQERWTGMLAVEGQEIDPSSLLRSHESKEHDVLYPLADKVLGTEEARKVIAKMRTEVDKS